MKKIKNFFEKNVRLFVGILIGGVLVGGSVYAATIIGAGEVSYTNNSQSTVGGALDDLYTKAANCKSIKNNTVRFAFGTPITSSTTDYTTLNKDIFVALNGDQKSVCIIRNSKLHCFDNNNWTIEKDHIQQVFSDISCTVKSSSVYCIASGFNCFVRSDGYVSCSDSRYAVSTGCNMDSDGAVDCH